jgi:hypothetical protein
MPTVQEICQLVNNGCCSPSDAAFKTYVLQLLCDLAGVDTEQDILCDPNTGDKIRIVTVFDDSGQVVSVTAYNLDGTPYAGDINALVTCVGDEPYVVRYPICDNGFQKIAVVCYTGCTLASISYVGINNQPVAAPVDFNLVKYGECSTNVELVKRCMCDDVNGDGSVITSYVEAYGIEITNNVITSTLLGTFTDETFQTTYAPVNPTQCNQLGDRVISQRARRIVLQGANSFSPPHILTGTITVMVIEVADVNNPPTFTDSSGATTPMVVGESFSFALEDGNINFNTLPIVTTNAGDRVHVTWMEPV